MAVRPDGRATAALKAVAVAPLLVQLVLLVRRSLGQYAAGDLAVDFSIFAQAWHQIGHGDLDPVSTLVGFPYWRSHLELIMWPLALVGRVLPSPATLLVLQDLAVVGSEAVAVLWVLEVVRRDRELRAPHLLPVAVAVVLLLTNPMIRRAAVGDFHFQAFATLFLLCAARSLWRGSPGRALLWLLPALMTGDVAGTYVAGLGLSAVIARRDTRLPGIALVVLGAAWSALIGALGANLGSAIDGYEPLVGHPLPARGALVVVAAAVLLHPSRPLAVLRGKSALLGHDLALSGGLGLLHPWTAGVVLVVLIENALQSSAAFFSPFQNFPATLFGTAGTALVIDWLARRRSPSGRALLGQGVALAAVAGVALLTALGRPPTEPTGYPEPPAAAAQMRAVDRLLTPQDQVITSFGIVGRFADRRYVTVYRPGPVQTPAPRVVFVLSHTVGNVTVGDAEYAAELAGIARLGAVPILVGEDVQAYAWLPAGRVTTLP